MKVEKIVILQSIQRTDKFLISYINKHLTLLLFIGLTLGQSPCDDKLFKELDMKIKNQGLDALSEREWTYYQLKSDECKNEKKVSKTFDTKFSKKEKLLNHRIKKYDSNFIAKKTFFTIFFRLTSIIIVASLINLYR